MANRDGDRRMPSFAQTRGAADAGRPRLVHAPVENRSGAAKGVGRGPGGRPASQPTTGGLRTVGIILGLAAIAGLLALLAYIILSNTSAFTIASIDAEPTEHVSAEAIARLANVPEGTTLLNVNEDLIREGIRKNPWVAAVDIEREFPDRLRISVTEREIGSLVVMGSDGVVWCLGRDDVWIEPLELALGQGQSAADAALTTAHDLGVVLITDVPESVSPVAAYEATDDELRAVNAFREQLSAGFLGRVVSMSAPSDESIACVLNNGVKVSFGAPTNISVKESLVTQLLDTYPNRITYINVRVPSNPSYRMIDTESVQEGTRSLDESVGVQGQDGSAVDMYGSDAGMSDGVDADSTDGISSEGFGVSDTAGDYVQQ